jgi:hypothetical protein
VTVAELEAKLAAAEGARAVAEAALRETHRTAATATGNNNNNNNNNDNKHAYAGTSDR